MVEEKPIYNKLCPAHDHYCWAHRQLMRKDDLVCTKDYKRLSKEMQLKLWEVKNRFNNRSMSELSIIVDWLLEHPLKEDTECKG